MGRPRKQNREPFWRSDRSCYYVQHDTRQVRLSPDKDEAWRLIEYLSEPAVQQRFHALTGNLPPRRSTWSDPRLEGDPYARAFRAQLERVKPAPAVPEWERIVNEMQLVAEQVVRGSLAIEAAPAELDRRVDAMLEKRRWMLERTAGAR